MSAPREVAGNGYSLPHWHSCETEQVSDCKLPETPHFAQKLSDLERLGVPGTAKMASAASQQIFRFFQSWFSGAVTRWGPAPTCPPFRCAGRASAARKSTRNRFFDPIAQRFPSANWKECKIYRFRWLAMVPLLFDEQLCASLCHERAIFWH